MNGPENNRRQNDDNPAAPRLALFFSALVFPGAGQFVQKRWLAGVFFATLFSVAAVFLLITIFVPLLWNLRALVESAGADNMIVLRPIPYARIFSWFGILLLVFAAGLLDTAVHQKRKKTG